MPIVCAVDPGSEQSAIVMFDGCKVHFAKILQNAELLAMLRGSRDALAGKLLAVEMIGHYGTGMPAGKTVFDTCVMIGRIIEIGEAIGARVEKVFRKDVKIHLCGTMRAKDKNIRQALIDKHGKPDGISSHLWAALAVADYAIEKLTP